MFDTFKNRLEITVTLRTITALRISAGRSRGLGVVKLEVNQMHWFDTEDEPNRLLTYLQNLIKGEMTTYQCSPEGQNALKQDWTDALITHLRQKVSSLSKTEVN